MTTDGPQHLRRETLVFAQEAEDAGHAADSGVDLSEEFGLCARA
jgi:hypothetical protein